MLRSVTGRDQGQIECFDDWRNPDRTTNCAHLIQDHARHAWPKSSILVLIIALWCIGKFALETAQMHSRQQTVMEDVALSDRSERASTAYFLGCSRSGGGAEDVERTVPRTCSALQQGRSRHGT
jgi:uncharacterized membrane protein YgcG